MALNLNALAINSAVFLNSKLFLLNKFKNEIYIFI